MGALMSIWLAVVLGILLDLGVFTRSKFIAFGPRADLTFMHVSIDTYYKYNMLLAMIVCHTFITDLIADSLAPHVLNVVQDTKNRYIPHRSRTYYMITSMWSIYCSVTQLFVIFIAFGQMDLLLVRLGSDLIANFFTLNMYLDGKIYDPHLYAKNMPHTKNSTRGTDDHDCDEREEDHETSIIRFTINDEEDDLGHQSTATCDEASCKAKSGHALMKRGGIFFDKLSSQQDSGLEAAQQQQAEHSLTIEEEKQGRLTSNSIRVSDHKNMNDEDDEKKALLQAK